MVNLRWSVCNDKKKFAEILLKRIFANYLYEELYKLEDRGSMCLLISCLQECIHASLPRSGKPDE